MSSLIEYEANYPVPQEPRLPMPEMGAEDSSTDLMELAWRSRWLILLAVIVGGGAGWGMLQRAVPRYTAESRIYVEQTMPQILNGNVQFGTMGSSLYTQAELIRSTPVLMAALEAPENSHLATFREVESPLALLRKQLDVQVGKNDDIINVSIELANANDAAQIVNSVVDAYIAKYAEQRRTDVVEVLTILRDEKERRDAELLKCQGELEQFRKENAALAVQVGKENVITKRFATLAGELDKTEMVLLDAKARHKRTQQMLKIPSQQPYLLELARGQQQVANDIRLENQLELELQKQLQELDLRIASERATWGDGHPRIRLLLSSKTNLERQLQEQKEAIQLRKKAIIAAYVETVAQEYAQVEMKRVELQRSYDKQFKLAMQVSSQAQKLAMLENTLDRTTRLVDILDDRIKEVNLSEDVGAMNVSIMEVAVPATNSSYPKATRFLGIGVLLGGLVGFGLAWLRDMMDHRFKSFDEIASALQLPVLGSLPLTNSGDRAVVGRTLLTHPRSALAESLRTLRTAIHFGLAGDEAKIITITSPTAGDGKSTVASNLALAMAQADRRVLLIDADMRKPVQHTIFEVGNKQGLSTLLTGRYPAAEVIVKTEDDRLDLLPCGPLPSNPVELLNNGGFAELLEELKGTYDRIIIDSPPVLPVADARVISAQSDATLLVLRAEKTTRRAGLAARDELTRVRAERIGVIVNGVSDRKQSSYASGYGYGYGNYGDAAYGKSDPLPLKGKAPKSRPPELEAELAGQSGVGLHDV